MGEQCDTIGELDLSIMTEVKPYDLDSSEDISSETCEEKIEPTILDFDDDVLSIENESFLCGFDVNVSLDVDLCAEYASFLLTPSKLTSFLNLASPNL